MTQAQIPAATGSMITAEGQESVLRITFRNPPVNALTRQFISEFRATIKQVQEHHRVIVIQSALPRTFMAGGDIEALATPGTPALLEYVETLQTLFADLKNLSIPVVCYVHGHCLGGGLELALAADIIVARDDAVLGLPEVKLGILPAAGGVHHLARRIGEGRARTMLLTGRSIAAQNAFDVGLIDFVVTRDGGDSFVEKLAADLAELPRAAVGAIKQLAGESLDHSVADGFGYESRAWLVARSSDESQAALNAFLSRSAQKSKDPESLSSSHTSKENDNDR